VETLGLPMPMLTDKAKGLSALAKAMISEITDRHGRLHKRRPRGTGIIDYVWRMVAFQISTMDIHHCMPIMAPFYLPSGMSYEKWNELQDELNGIANEICDTIPVDQWHGIAKWSNLI